MEKSSADQRQKFIALISASLYPEGSQPAAFKALSLSKPIPAGIPAADLKRIDLRLISLRGLETLSWNFRYQQRDETKNFPVPEGINLVEAALGRQFLCADLHCQDATHSLRIDRKGQAHLISQRLAPATAPLSAGPLSHDRPKQRHIAADSAWLQVLGISDPAGQVIPRMQDKFRQIDKFIEIVDDLSQDLLQKSRLSVVDMGSGKAYLTFALFDFLRSRCQVEALGVEQRADLVGKCNDFALAAGFSPQLSFVEGSIAHWQPLPGSPFATPDILVALHACDTATDDAIATGIRAGAALIICSPCCHKQLRSNMASQARTQAITRFGILEERLAEIITDSIRALVLEAHGYKAKVFEFVSAEHTGKNLMITAQRLAGAVPVATKSAKLAEARQLAADFGVSRHYLLEILD